MIECFTGLPGSGKSLDAAARIKAALSGKRWVVSNFKFNVKKTKHPKHFLYVPNDKLTPQVLEHISRNIVKGRGENRILLVVDECAVLWNSRNWQKNTPFVNFFAVHRKLGYNCILICQDLKTVDKQIRALVEIETQHRNFCQFGFIGWAWKQFFRAPLVLCISYWAPLCGHGKCKAAKAGTKLLIGRKSLYTLYDTFQGFSAA